MNRKSQKAITLVRKCIETERISITLHFRQRMDQRGLFWPDVLAVINDPDDVHSQGLDDYSRPKWIICGRSAIGDEIEIVCAIEVDESGTQFITLYWNE